MDFAFTGLPCFPAFFGALFMYHPLWNPRPIADFPTLTMILTPLSLVLTLAVTLRTKSSTRKLPISQFAAVLVLSVLFTPLAAEHHYVLLAMPLFVLLSSLNWQTLQVWQIIGLGIISYLILGWTPVFPIGLLDGWMKIFTFPKLYGGVFLWFLLLIMQQKYSHEMSSNVKN
jgi:hypothetical protein